MIPGLDEKEPNMKLKWYGALFSSILIFVSFCGAANTENHGKKYQKWLKQAKAHYAQMKPLPPVHPQRVRKDQLQSPVTTCIAEVNAATPIDVSCTIPSETSFYGLYLYLKNGMDDDQGFNWKLCGDVEGDLCPGANGSWYTAENFLQEDGGQWGVQVRVVPFTSCNGGPCVVRGRMIVLIGGTKQKP
jgi:hypothetical protein